jgi:acyl-coenzyme A synthetase/AMP-(fatty) acid ligase
LKLSQVAPSELEHVLLTHPDVVDAAVVGIPDEDSGELPRAYVIKRSNSSLTEEQVAAFVEGILS